MVERLKNSISKGFVTNLNASYWLAVVVLATSSIATLSSIASNLAPDTFSTSWASMNPVTAIGLLLCAALMLMLRKLILTSENKLPPLSRHLTIACLSIAGLVTILGIFELNSDLIGINLTFENLFLGQGKEILIISQQRSASAAVNSSLLLLSGFGFFSLILAPTWPWIWQLSPSFGIIIATLFSYSFLFNTELSRGDLHFSKVPLNTCLSFLFLFIGMLFLRADVGLFRPFNSTHMGAQILRTRGPLMFVLFFILAKGVQAGVNNGIYDIQFGFVIFITLSSASFFFIFYALALEFNLAYSRLQASEVFNKTIMDVCPGMITIFRAKDHQYVFVSSRISSILGYDPIEITSHQDILSYIAHPDDLPHLLRERKAICNLPDNGLHTYSFRWRHKDRSWRTLLTTSTPYKRDAEGNVLEILSCSTDITDIVQLQESLEKKNRELNVERQKILQSNRDLEIFASVAAHDLKSPLQSVSSWIGVLEESLSDQKNEVITDALKFIEQSAKKSISLISDLLNISRLNSENATHEKCDIKKVIQYVLQTLDREIKNSDARITIGDLPTTQGIQVQYEALFSNLLRNAINYRSSDRPLKIEIGGTAFDDHYEFYVRDNGLGIPKQHQDSIFDLFTRVHADDEHPGNGLGLAYCRKVIELLGGRIWVESDVEKGSTFKFSIPKA